MRFSRFLKPVAYLQRPTCARLFFTLPSFPAARFGFSDNKDASSRDGDEPEGNEDEVQRYHERKILPWVAIRARYPCSSTYSHVIFNRYSQKELYNLVVDVDCYHHFLPFCHASKVLNASRPNWKSNPGDGPVELEAELKVGFLGIEESYISLVSCNPYESMEVRNIPTYRPSVLLILYFCSSQQVRAATATPLFKTLITTWRFQTASSTSLHPSTSHIDTLARHVSRLSLDDGIHANKPDDLSHTAPTLLTFDIVFAFSNPLHASVSNAFFGRVSRMMVRAFEERCIGVYGLRTL